MKKPSPFLTPEPRAAARRGRVSIRALAVAALLAGCMGRGPDTRAPMANIPAARGREGSVAPEFTSRLVSNHDLRRHTPVALGEVFGIDVSPDGNSILYASSQDGTTPNLYLKEESSAAPVRKTSSTWWDLHPRFSPDGKRIAYASNRDGNFDVWIIPAGAAGGAEQVTSSPDDEVHPAWSPDGKKLAYCRLSPVHGWTLWVLDRENGTTVELGWGLYPDWSPAGDWIAFQKPSDREPRWFGLWLVRPDGSELRQLVHGDGFGAVEPSWSPDGKLLAYCAVEKGAREGQGAHGSGIWVVEAAGGKIHQITGGTEGDSSPAWGLGGRIYFVSQRLGVPGIWSLVPPEVEG